MFEITDASLSGLRLIGRKPVVLAWWIGFNLIAAAVTLSLAYVLFGEILRQFFEVIASAAGAAKAGGVNEKEIGQKVVTLLLQMIPRFGIAVLVLLPVGLLVAAMRRNAAARAMLTPADDRFGYLRIGPDEFRSAVVILALGLILAVVQVVFAAGIGVVSAIYGGGHEHGGNVLGAVILRDLLQIPLTVLQVYLFLKFAFAVPHTLATKRISIFESWSLTNGHVLRMLLAYLIVVVIGIIVSIVLGLLAFMLLAAAGGAQLVQLVPILESNPQDGLNRLFGMLPMLLVVIGVLSALFRPVLTALYYCPAAYIYDHVVGEKTEAAFS
jgi:hypothetical protein